MKKLWEGFMKKVLVGGVFLLSSLAVSSSCFAGAYFAGNLGIVAVEDSGITSPAWAAAGISNVEASFDNGFGLSLAAGSTITDVIRAEAEFSYRKNDLDSLSASYLGTSITVPVDGKAESMTLMGNVLADIKTNSIVTPFVGLGIGYSRADVELDGESEDDMVFAYQLILGTGFKVSDAVNIDVSYRYFATTDPDFDGTEVEYGTHNFMAGVRVNF